MVRYLEGLEAAAIAEVVGLSSGAVAMKIHRAKRALARKFQGGNRQGEQLQDGRRAGVLQGAGALGLGAAGYVLARVRRLGRSRAPFEGEPCAKA